MSLEKIHDYLDAYRAFQEKILVVYHPTNDSYWNDRCFVGDDRYDATKPYNHRGILDNEVVIEFDDGNKERNRELAYQVSDRLSSNGLSHSVWFSGNKSYHVHVLLRIGGVHDIPGLKRCFMREYCVGLPLPDLQLAARHHLVRAEFGVHEKTGNYKHLCSHYGGPLIPNDVPVFVWDAYAREQRERVARRLSRNNGSLLTHPGVQYILTAHQFREAQDGRERALFMLIHLLKKQYPNKEELTQALQTWYRYSSTKPGFSDREIARKVDYHYLREYNISERYVNELLESIGRQDLCLGSPKKQE